MSTITPLCHTSPNDLASRNAAAIEFTCRSRPAIPRSKHAIHLSAYAVVALASILHVEEADAGIVTYTSRASFEAAVGPTEVEDFNSFSSEVAFDTTPLDLGDFTLSKSRPIDHDRDYIDLPPLQFSSMNVDGTTIANVFVSRDFSLLVTFDNEISAFGTDLASFSSLTATDILIGGTMATGYSQSSGVQFLGFQSDTPFTTVEFRMLSSSDGNGFGMDNITYPASATVPEPSSLAAIVGILASAGVTTAGRRRLRQKRRSG